MRIPSHDPDESSSYIVRWRLLRYLLRCLLVITLVLVAALVAFRVMNLGDKPQQATVIQQDVTVKNMTTGTDGPIATENVLKWQKQIEAPPGDEDSRTVAFEKILPGHAYQKGTLEVPPGWKAQWSTSQVQNGSDASFTDVEPESGVTFIRIYTDKVTTTKPVAQAPLTQPLDQEKIDSPEGARTLAAKEFNNRVFIFYKSVDVSDGLTDGADMTVGCLDIRTYKSCNDTGVTFPTYMSSASGTKLGQAGSVKDISTPASMQYGFDDGSYGHEGHLYMPAQRGNHYGVNCIDLLELKNCGFTSMGQSLAPPQLVGSNPTRISGFAVSGNRLYGNATTDNDNGVRTDDFMKVTCFDMATNSRCDGYTGASNTPIPSYYIGEHGGEYATPAQDRIIGDKYFFLLNYDEANMRNTFFDTPYTQALYGNRLVCYNVSSQTPCDGWPTSTLEYRQPVFECTPGCSFVPKTQKVYGAMISEDAFQLVKPRQLIISKDNQGNELAICAFSGSASGVDPGFVCNDLANGANNTSARPAGLLPTQWLNVPWSPAPAVTQITNQNTDRVYAAYHLPANSAWGGRPKAAMICYDWKAQAQCAGFRKPHYWYEIDQADSLDAAYIPNGKCMIGVSGYNYLWSFDADTGETPCRKTRHETTIDPHEMLTSSYCDSNGARTSSWGRLQLNSANMYDFKEVNITIKDKTGAVVGAFNKVDIKDLGRLDLSSIPFSGNTDELQVEVDSVVWNTSPWANIGGDPANPKKLPLISVVMNAPPAQYCYQTKVEPRCNISSVSTKSDFEVVSSNATLTNQITKSLTVNQQADQQCFKNLKLETSISQSRVKTSDSLTYTVGVKNLANPNPNNLGTVTGAQIKAILPAGVAYVSSSGNGTLSGNQVTWKPDAIAPGQNLELTVTTSVKGVTSKSRPGNIFFGVAEAASETPLTFSASVSYASDAPSQANTTSNTQVIYVAESVPEATPTPTPELTPEATPTPAPELPAEEVIEEEAMDDNNVPSNAADGDTDRLSALERGDLAEGQRSGTLLGALIPVQVVDVLRMVPRETARYIPFAIIFILVILAFIYANQAWIGFRNIRLLREVVKRYRRTELANKNFIALTSHYLNTPVAIMKASAESLLGKKVVPDDQVKKLSVAIDNLSLDIKKMLAENDNFSQHIEHTSTDLQKIKVGTIIRSLHIVIPFVLCVVILTLVNFLLTEADRYNFTVWLAVLQALVLVFGGLGLILAYVSYRRNMESKKRLNRQLALDNELSQHRTDFIVKSHKYLNEDIKQIKSALTPAVKKSHEIAALRDAMSSMESIVIRFGSLAKYSKPIEKMPESISLTPVVGKALELFESAQVAKDINVLVDVPVDLTVSIGQEALRQVIDSVLDNAFEFTDAKGEISIKAYKKRENVIVEVKDNGIGIEPDKIAQLLTPFSRASDVLQFNHEGIGLSLYLDKVILEQVGGELHINSTVKKGTTVVISLPSL